MAKLNIIDRDNVLREFEIAEDLITMGREATNKLVVADPSVSRQHAWLEKREDGYYLIDKNSSNGSFINGKKISEQKLNHNDKVNLGSVSLVFEDEEQVSATFILPRGEVPEGMKPQPPTEEVPTNAVPIVSPKPPVEPPSPPPPPPPVPPPPPHFQAAGPPPPHPPYRPPEPSAVVCPSCKKTVEAGARFCGFCGASIAAQKPAAPPPPPPPAARPPVPPPPVSAAPPPPPPLRAQAPPVPPPPPRQAPMVPPSPVAAPQQMPRTFPAPGALNYAGFGPRTIAFFLDAIILGFLIMLPMAVASFAFIVPAAQGQEPGILSLIIFMVCILLTIVLSIGYQVYFIGVKGATPGKKILKLRVTLPDGQYPVGMGKAFIRMLMFGIGNMLCYYSIISILLDKEQHRGWHNKVAGTIVIKES